jgi:hypothetical protein
MHRSLLLIVASQALTYEVLVEPLPSTLQLPAELAQTYRDWRFGPGRAASCSPLSGRARR